MKLYELSEQYRNLSEYLLTAEPDSEYISEATKQLGEISEQFTVKAENIGKIIMENQAESKALEAEIKRLSARKETLDNKTEWLKNYLQVEMITAKTEKIEGNLLTLTLQKSPPSCIVTDQTLVPKIFIKIIPQQEQVDRVAILTNFRNNGEIPPGCNIVADKKTLRIR